MLQCDSFVTEVVTMAIAPRIERQAARCAALAKQTHDEDGRERLLRLEQMYRQLAESERGLDPAQLGPAQAG